MVSAGVFVGERPVKGGDVDAAASLAHQIEPRLVDRGVSGAGIKLQPFRDALQQNDPYRQNREEDCCVINGLVVVVVVSVRHNYC